MYHCDSSWPLAILDKVASILPTFILSPLPPSTSKFIPTPMLFSIALLLSRRKTNGVAIDCPSESLTVTVNASAVTLPLTFSVFNLPTEVNDDDLTDAPNAFSPSTVTPLILYVDPGCCRSIESGLMLNTCFKVPLSTVRKTNSPTSLPAAAVFNLLSNLLMTCTLPFEFSAAKSIPTPILSAPLSILDVLLFRINIDSTVLLDANSFSILMDRECIAPSESYTAGLLTTIFPGDKPFSKFKSCVLASTPFNIFSSVAVASTREDPRNKPVDAPSCASM